MKNIGKEGHTETSTPAGPYTAEMHAAMVDKIMTPNTTSIEPKGLRDTDDGPYWGKQLSIAPLGATRC